MNRLLVLVLFILFAETGCSYPDFYKFGTGGKAILCVPSREMDQYILPDDHEMIDLVVGVGRAPGFGFYFDEEYIRNSIPGFVIREEFSGHPYVNALSGSIGLLGNAVDIDSINSSVYARNTEEMWYATGECNNPSIIKLKNTGLYRVKCKKFDDYSSIWNKVPEKGIPLPDIGDLIIATCINQEIDIGPYSGYEDHKCRRVFATEQFKVDYQIQEENLAVVEQLDEFIKTQLSQWQKNCY
jgi:hypothetical protein